MIFNLTRRQIISRNTFSALSFTDRLRGMIGRDFTCFDAMVFSHCSAIHTLFMGIPLDVVFLDKGNTVLKLAEHLAPWHLCISCRGAFSVIELPAGMIQTSGTQTGDKFDLSAGLSAEGKNVLREALTAPCCNVMKYSDSSKESGK